MSSAPRAAHVAAASLNQTVGDWDGNLRRILAAIACARSRGARLLALPEMCVPGYSLGDRLLMQGTLDRSWDLLRSVLPATRGIAVCLGLPVRHRGVLYNAVAVVADGRLAGLAAKENLATGDVEYENRWFQGWPRGQADVFEAPDGTTVPIGSLLFEARGLGTFAVEICEDGWKGLRPGSISAIAGALILVNPSASWFCLGKHAIRRRLVRQISREDHTAYVYTSLLGCDATRLVYDGSVLIGHDGEIVSEGRRFRFAQDFEIIDEVVDLQALRHARMEEGSWRQQVSALERGEYGPVPALVRIDSDLSTEGEPRPPKPYWTAGTSPEPPDPSLAWLAEEGLVPRAPTEPDLPHLELELGICLGIREYLRKTGIPGIALALSGGRDSAMCALLVRRMFRYDRPDLDETALSEHVAHHFVTAWLGTSNSSPETKAAARSVAEEVGARHQEVDLQEAVDLHVELVRRLTGREIGWDDPACDLPLQNVQARLRASLVWFVANLDRFLLLSTSNKSEAAVGYATMDGDTAGGLAPIADVPKSLVGSWLRWAARFYGLSSIGRVEAVPATAELRPADRVQTDEGDLMPYEVLDQLTFLFVQRGQEPLEMFRTLWPAVEARYGGDAKAFAAHVRRFVTLVCASQWKRERFAISFRVTSFDLDPRTGFRFPPVQAPFAEELAEMDAWVSGLAAESAPDRSG